MQHSSAVNDKKLISIAMPPEVIINWNKIEFGKILNRACKDF